MDTKTRQKGARQPAKRAGTGGVLPLPDEPSYGRVTTAESPRTSRLLAREDLVELTDYRRPADQRRWLEREGIPYRVGATGRPKVLWADLVQQEPAVRWEPNWNAIPRRG